MRVLQDLAALVGAAHVLGAESQTDSYCVDERALYHGRALAVVRPGTRQELVRVMSLCHAAKLAMVPHGGNTGYCGGATPDSSGSQLVISLERLDRIIAIDTVAATLTVEAGVTLADAQAAATAAGLLLPLSMGSQGSCQIGGNLSTNAGGLAVLRYGTARDLTLGLEVVLPDGRLLSQLQGLRKDNTGYDLKQLFIGAEGTLGIISAATLKLFPRPRAMQTVFAAVRDVGAATTLLSHVRAQLGDNVTSCEYLSANAMAQVAALLTDVQRPFTVEYAHYVLLEWAEFGDRHGPSAAHDIEQLFSPPIADGLVLDAVIAHSEKQRLALWRLRENVPAAEKALGGSIKHDISVPLGEVAEYVGRTSTQLLARWPTLRLSVYGHIGDGNVHFNVLAPIELDAAAFKRTHGADISALVHEIAQTMGGSFSAEHGVGLLKRDLLAQYAGGPRLEAMRAIKDALDPGGLMNPGKLL